MAARRGHLLAGVADGTTARSSWRARSWMTLAATICIPQAKTTATTICAHATPTIPHWAANSREGTSRASLTREIPMEIPGLPRALYTSFAPAPRERTAA